jgi:hypothetical protein
MGFAEDFFNMLQTYNETVVPITVLTFLLGIVAIYLVSRKFNQAGKFVSFILGFLWLWSGLAFNILFFGPTDVEYLGMTIAGMWYVSGVLFIIQSLLFGIYGIIKNELSFDLDTSLYSFTGVGFIIYAMVIYPLIGFLTGQMYPRYPIFGSAPCPVTIFTLGILLLTEKKVPLQVAVIPLIWGLMGIMPVLELSLYADVGLLLSGVVGFTLILLRNRSVEE